ncbi:hypothetical protein B1219_19275 [Pseudomonas ogarae]|uniref:RES family NAD+ phosphorylase n=1 Tax=Pseudomonas ogarae (strain DSM 112162 / CECT 30235 / F113) TaxID=1114970 RepID=UPI0009A34167|nr:RES family NAD+ phosphorylase [Pseudomonas ogarae]OPG72277.1 hypothetical protein B1219_19275 [Pseudomonas ogarae]OPG81314.1 hypothetical protein B1218_00505 [Pseudomonas ogarae]
MLDEYYLCEFCLSQNELQLEIKQRGVQIETCKICGSHDGKALLASDVRVRRIFRALIRLNFSEWDYNHHIGGSSLQGLIFNSKAIFNLPADACESSFEDVFLTMEETVGWYPDSEDDITLGGGYWDGGILDGLHNRRDHNVETLVRNALELNSFETESNAKGLIALLQPDIFYIIPAGTEFFRGRVGVASRLRKEQHEFHDAPNFVYLPYSGKQIDRPPMHLATEGRFNRTRTSVLYLASDAQTAVAELRPHPGHLVSTAKFKARRDINVANFANQDIRNFLNDKRLEKLRTILSIAEVLNVPIQPEHRYIYSVTQLLANAIRTEGFSGIMFNSSVGEGVNLTCFESDAFEAVESSECVMEVISLQYRIAEMPTVAVNHEHQELIKDEDSPFATLLYGMTRRKKQV